MLDDLRSLSLLEPGIPRIYPWGVCQSGSQSDLARVLDVHRSSISRAIHEAGSQFANLQIRIIQEVYPDYDVEKEEPAVMYRVTKK